MLQLCPNLNDFVSLNINENTIVVIDKRVPCIFILFSGLPVSIFIPQQQCPQNNSYFEAGFFNLKMISAQFVIESKTK